MVTRSDASNASNMAWISYAYSLNNRLSQPVMKTAIRFGSTSHKNGLQRPPAGRLCEKAIEIDLRGRRLA